MTNKRRVKDIINTLSVERSHKAVESMWYDIKANQQSSNVGGDDVEENEEEEKHAAEDASVAAPIGEAVGEERIGEEPAEGDVVGRVGQCLAERLVWIGKGHGVVGDVR
jgi:hypothetical protein